MNAPNRDFAGSSSTASSWKDEARQDLQRKVYKANSSLPKFLDYTCSLHLGFLLWIKELQPSSLHRAVPLMARVGIASTSFAAGCKALTTTLMPIRWLQRSQQPACRTWNREQAEADYTCIKQIYLVRGWRFYIAAFQRPSVLQTQNSFYCFPSLSHAQSRPNHSPLVKSFMPGPARRSACFEMWTKLSQLLKMWGSKWVRFQIWGFFTSSVSQNLCAHFLKIYSLVFFFEQDFCRLVDRIIL